ncbi:MAG: type ISP restriction/modification enzyme, partial [Chloroflexota bacterium]
EEHETGIANDWPRIPLPDNVAVLQASAALGTQIANLLDTEKPLLHITAGTIRDDMRLLGVRKGNNRSVTVNWGSEDSRGAVMPGRGDARERSYTDEELEAIERGVAALNIELDTALTLLGDTTYDLYLNDDTYWANVPANVYGYTIGGYQVIKKWLSYRNFNVLGRALIGDEVLEVTHMVRRIAALILLEPQLNNNYRTVKDAVYNWSQA